jgi:hypothetical protein
MQVEIDLGPGGQLDSGLRGRLGQLSEGALPSPFCSLAWIGLT